MDQANALDGLAALGQETRLRIFRHLVRLGPEGTPAGAIAAGLAVVPNTLSTHLDILVRARLIRRQREGRTITYAADIPGIAALLAFLTDDCCGGRPELCRPALPALACDC